MSVLFKLDATPLTAHERETLLLKNEFDLQHSLRITANSSSMVVLEIIVVIEDQQQQ